MSKDSIQGRLDVAGFETKGWVWDRSQPDAVLQVDLYDGNVWIGSIPADEFRHELLDAGVGNGKHAFTYALPPRLVDRQHHIIRAKVRGTEIELDNSPLEVALVPPPWKLY